MNKNVAGIDKTLRIVLGLVLIIAGLFAPLGAGLRVAAFAVAAIALFTGIFGF